MCITILCFPDSDVINFEINLIFLIKSFFCMTKKSRQNFKYLENEKSFSKRVRLSPSKIFFLICFNFNDSPSKMKKKLFISSSKLFSFSRYFIFVLTLWSCRKNSVIRKISLSSRFIAPQPGYQTITIHILSNIDELKTNQAMKFDQFIEYKRRNIFIQKSCRK